MLNHHSVQLAPGKEKPVLQGHPWIFSGALKTPPEKAAPGDLVDVLDHKRKFIARGYYNPHSQIRVRVLTRDESQIINEDFFATRIHSAIERRDHILASKLTTGVRLVCHEADQLPGLIVDLYGDWVSFQIVTAGMERWRDTVIACLREYLKPVGIVERSDENVREKEGLALRKEVVTGSLPDASISFLENGRTLSADLWQGHKTGFYLDQRDNRRLIGDFSQGFELLNCFSFSGGFSVFAKAGGARRIINVDESQPALELSKHHLEINHLSGPEDEFIRADVFKFLREKRAEGKTFDMIVLDPPKFVSSTSQIDKACRGYKDLNILAMQLLKPGGILATFSCSGLISRDLFQKVVFGASVDAGAEMQVVKFLSQAEDHPTLLSFPESLYLKGLLLKKL